MARLLLAATFDCAAGNTGIGMAPAVPLFLPDGERTARLSGERVKGAGMIAAGVCAGTHVGEVADAGATALPVSDQRRHAHHRAMVRQAPRG